MWKLTSDGWRLDLGLLGDLSVYPVPGEPADRCWRAVWSNNCGDAGWDQDGFTSADNAKLTVDTWLHEALAQATAALDGVESEPQRYWRVVKDPEPPSMDGDWFKAVVCDARGYYVTDASDAGWRHGAPNAYGLAKADGRASGLEEWKP